MQTTADVHVTSKRLTFNVLTRKQLGSVLVFEGDEIALARPSIVRENLITLRVLIFSAINTTMNASSQYPWRLKMSAQASVENKSGYNRLQYTI